MYNMIDKSLVDNCLSMRQVMTQIVRVATLAHLPSFQVSCSSEQLRITLRVTYVQFGMFLEDPWRIQVGKFGETVRG